MLWAAGVVVEASDSTAITRFNTRPFHFHCNDSRQVVHTQCAALVVQYNLLLAKGSAAGKVTAGLAENNGSLTAGIDYSPDLPDTWNS